MNGLYAHAAYAIGIAILLDSMDGFIARLTHSTSAFGLQLDSLADVISFGIAPSVLALVWGMQPVDQRLAWIAAFTFTICGAMRLARDLGPGRTIVTVLCDSGQRYGSKIYDPAFLAARHLPTPEWLNR